MTRKEFISLLPIYTGTYRQTIKHGFQSPIDGHDLLAYKQASDLIVRSRSGGFAYPISVYYENTILKANIESDN